MGAWARPMLRLLAGLKGVRGTPFDVFGYGAHRRLERSLADWYKDLIRRAIALRQPDHVTIIQELACLPDQIRGYEQIKEESIARVKGIAEEKLRLLKQLQATQTV